MRITGRFDSPAADTCRFTDEATQIMPELGETDDLFLRFSGGGWNLDTFHFAPSRVIPSESPISPFVLPATRRSQ